MLLTPRRTGGHAASQSRFSQNLTTSQRSPGGSFHGSRVMGAEKQNVANRIPADVALIVFGRDRSRKLRASRFGAAAVTSAQAAARSMGMQAMRIVTPEQRLVALKLPKGSVSAAGKAVVPFMKRALYDKVVAIAGADMPSPPTPPASSPKPVRRTLKPGDTKPVSIGGSTGFAKGAVMLATDDLAVGWWAATVQFVDGELLTLRWQSQEWRDLPTFIRRLSQVAPMPKGKPC